MSNIVMRFDLKTLTDSAGRTQTGPSGHDLLVPVLVKAEYHETNDPMEEAFCDYGGWADPNDANKALYPVSILITPGGTNYEFGPLVERNDLLDCEPCSLIVP
jgi:hypothetical protein